MLHFYYFDQRNTLRNLQIVSINSIKWFGMENCSLSFLDIKISHENNKFVTPLYRKPTFSDIFTNFESFIPDLHISGSTETLLHISFR